MVGGEGGGETGTCLIGLCLLRHRFSPSYFCSSGSFRDPTLALPTMPHPRSSTVSLEGEVRFILHNFRGCPSPWSLCKWSSRSKFCESPPWQKPREGPPAARTPANDLRTQGPKWSPRKTFAFSATVNMGRAPLPPTCHICLRVSVNVLAISAATPEQGRSPEGARARPLSHKDPL